MSKILEITTNVLQDSELFNRSWDSRQTFTKHIKNTIYGQWITALRRESRQIKATLSDLAQELKRLDEIIDEEEESLTLIGNEIDENQTVFARFKRNAPEFIKDVVEKTTDLMCIRQSATHQLSLLRQAHRIEQHPYQRQLRLFSFLTRTPLLKQVLLLNPVSSLMPRNPAQDTSEQESLHRSIVIAHRIYEAVNAIHPLSVKASLQILKKRQVETSQRLIANQKTKRAVCEQRDALVEKAHNIRQQLQKSKTEFGSWVPPTEKKAAQHPYFSSAEFIAKRNTTWLAIQKKSCAMSRANSFSFFKAEDAALPFSPHKRPHTASGWSTGPSW